jgi:hypothetical protein
LCDFGIVLDGSYPTLTIELYDIVPYISETNPEPEHAYMYDSWKDEEGDFWGGYYRAVSSTDVKGGHSVTVVFYPDINSNGEYDPAAEQLAKFEYPTTTHPAGTILPIYVGYTPNPPYPIVDRIPAVDGLGLLASLEGPYLCQGFMTVISTLFGPRDICVGETELFYTAEGMDLYEFYFGANDGSPMPTRIPLEGGTADDYDFDNQIRLVFNSPGSYWISIRYMVPALGNSDMKGEWTGRTYMNIRVHERPELVRTSTEDITVCRGTQIDLSTFVEETTGLESIISYFIKETDGSYTFIANDEDGEPIYVTPYETTVYGATVMCEATGCEWLDTVDFQVNVIPMLQVWATVETQPTCGQDNGVIVVTVAGGNGNYEYSFDDETYAELPEDGILDALGAGTYIIYVKDVEQTACEASICEPVTLTPLTGLFAFAEVTPAADCETDNGTITLVANGGLPPYQYSIDGEAYENIPADGILGTDFGAKMYTILVMDANECIAATTATILATNGLEVTLTPKTDANCDAEGSASIAITGGDEPFFYRLPGEAWVELTADSIRFTAGYHIIEIKDANDCETTAEVTIDNVETLTATLDEIVDIDCQGATLGGFTVTATGAEPFTYSVNLGYITGSSEDGVIEITDLQTGTYQIVVTDFNNCTYTMDGIEINVGYEYLKAENDLYYTYVNQEVTGYVLYNDFDVKNRPITMQDRTYTAAHGEITFDLERGSFVYMPDEDFTGTDLVQYFIENDCGMESSAWLIIVVLPREDDNYPVFALDDYYTINEGETLNAYTILKNDYATGGFELQEPPTIQTGVSNGTLILNNDGTFIYTPNYGFTGVDMFTYEICNDDDPPSCATAEAHIIVLPNEYLDDNLLANNDAYTVMKYHTLEVETVADGVMGNDKYTCAEPFVTLLDNVEHGELTLAADGTFTYTPTLGYAGPDGFTYILCCEDSDVDCDTAYVFIMVIEGDCPDMPVIVKDAATICETGSVDITTLISDESENIEPPVVFYTDNTYTAELASTVVSTQGWYYFRAYNIYECFVEDSVYVKVKPHATAALINAEDVNICNDNYAVLTASSNLDDPTYTWYNAAGNVLTVSDTYTTGTFTVTTNTDTTLYVSVYNDDYCENLANARKPVTVHIFPTPELTAEAANPHLCGANFFTINAALNVGTDITGVTYIWERQDLPAATFSPANGITGGASGPVIGTSRIFTYYPDATDYVNRDIVLRITINSPVCDPVFEIINLSIDASEPDAEFEFVEQPEEAEPCEDVEYILKITELDAGGLTDISVTLNDLFGSDLDVKDAFYLYPIWLDEENEEPNEDWQPMNFSSTYYRYTGTIPAEDEIVLESGDSLLVKFIVAAECGFYSGNTVDFLLNAWDACHSFALETQTITSDPFELDFGVELPEFEITSIMQPLVINNETDPIIGGDISTINRTVVWEVTLKHLGTTIPFGYLPETENIYFNIPTGMAIESIISTDEISGFNFTDPEYIFDEFETGYTDPATLEFAIPLSEVEDLEAFFEGEEIVFEITFTVTELATCGSYDFYVEIIHEDELECWDGDEMVPCPFGHVLDGDYQTLDVNLYDIVPYIDEDLPEPEHAYMYDGDLWGGYYRAISHSGAEAGRFVKVVFYADMNNNGAYDEGIDIKMTEFNYPTSDHPAGTILPIYVGYSSPFPSVDLIPTESGYGLLASLEGPYLCQGFMTVVATMFGPRDICSGDTEIGRAHV